MATEVPAVWGLSAQDTASLLETARRAPSLHNTQPWAFRLTPTAIELYADPTRRLPVAGREHRECSPERTRRADPGLMARARRPP